MAATPDIFTLALAPTPAILGPATRIVVEDGCPVCGTRPPPEYAEVEFLFDFWGGEDLIQALDTYGASERLRHAIEGDGLRGAGFRPALTTAAEGFWLAEGAYADTLPSFALLDITGRAAGPERWYTRSTCEACGRTSWERTDKGAEAETAAISGAVGTPRPVYRDAWQGDDLFRLEDPGLPLVTAPVADLFARLGTPGVVVHPAAWVDRG